MDRSIHCKGVVAVFVLTLSMAVGARQSLVYSGSESYLSDVSLERFYLMEENMMSNTDALMRKDYFGLEDEETEEEHQQHAINFTDVEGILVKAKDLHRQVGPDLWNFLGHPINVLHLFRRLNEEWTKALDLILNSTPCKMWKITAMKRYINFLRGSMPGDEDTRKLVNHMSRLQSILGSPTREVANGKLGNIRALEPLNPDEQFAIGKILYDQEDMSHALPWFELLDDWLKQATDEDKAKVNFKESELLKMMATGYYLAGQIDEAVNTSDRILDLDRSNPRSLENLNFFLMKQSFQSVGPTKPKPSVFKTKFERICAGQIIKPSRHRCFLLPVYGRGWFVYKQEVLRHKPPITIYHDVITMYAMEQIKDYAHSKLANKAWISPRQFVAPEMGLTIDYHSLPREKSIRYSVQELAFAFTSLPATDKYLLKGWGPMQIVNAGRSGFKLSRYDEKLDLTQIERGVNVGAMFAFLSEPKNGGEIVMTSQRVFSPIPKGSILVYYATQSKLHSLCPALGGSQWVAVQPFHELERTTRPSKFVLEI